MKKKMKGMKGMKGIFLSFLWFLFIPQFIGTAIDWLTCILSWAEKIITFVWPFGNIEHFLKPTNISLKTTIFSTQSHRSFTGSIQELFLFGTPMKNSNPAKMILSVMGS